MPNTFSLLLILCLILVESIGQLRAENPVRALLAENRPEEASAICRQYESVNTKDSDSLYACAWAYFRSKRIDSGDKILQKLSQQFSHPEFQLLSSYSRILKKQFEEAKKILDRVQSEQKGNAFGLTAQELNAEIYEAKGQLDTAAFLYKQIVGDDASRARAHWGLGRYYFSRSDMGRARTHFETTARLWPKHLGSRYHLALLSLGQESLGEAAKWLAECYKLDKADPGVLEQLGVLFEKRGMVKEAIRHWQKVVEVKKGPSLAKEKLAHYKKETVDSLVENQKYEEALGEVQKNSVKDDPKMLLRRALIYKNLGKYEKASADLLVYVNANPKEASALRELAICYLNLDQLNQAEEMLVRAIAEDAENGMNYAWMAYLLEKRNELPKALETWRRAVELLKEPAEMEKAQRKIASLEKKLNKKANPEP